MTSGGRKRRTLPKVPQVSTMRPWEWQCLATAAVAAFCHAHGLVVLTCGTFGNVLRFLPPLVIGEELLSEGMTILEEAFAGV